MEFGDLQKAVGRWASQTFPEQTLGSIIAHAKAELAELEQAAKEAFSAGTWNAIATELADVTILMMVAADHMNFQLEGAVIAKHGKNINRVWIFDPELGFHRHVAESAGEQLTKRGQPLHKWEPQK